MTYTDPISAQACGVIATVIPVLILASLLDSHYLKAVMRGGVWWATAIVGFLLTGYMVLGLAATVAACVGAANKDGAPGGYAVTIWFGLVISACVLLGVYVSRLIGEAKKDPSES